MKFWCVIFLIACCLRSDSGCLIAHPKATQYKKVASPLEPNWKIRFLYFCIYSWFRAESKLLYIFMSLKMLCSLKKIILYFLSVVIVCLKLVHRHLLFCAVQSVFLHKNLYPWWLIRTYLQNMFDLGQASLLYIRWGEVWSKWLFGYASLPIMLIRTESESVAITETFKFSKFPINNAFWIHECFLMQNKPFIWISSVLIPHSCGGSPGPCSTHYQL